MTPSPTDNLTLAFKSLWGASVMPFCAGAKPALEHPDFESLSVRISQLCAIGSSGLLHGANGVGKSYLISHVLEHRLPEKQFKPLLLTHSSLSGSDLLRSLCLRLSLSPKFRRSDNVAAITNAWQSLGNCWPVLIVEEAQNLSAVALEELRLLSCAKLEALPFSLILVGDNSLLAKLQLGVHAPLRSRLGYSLKLTALNHQQSRQYLEHGLHSASVHTNPFQPDAVELLIQACGGLPRIINHLAQRAMEAAALEHNASVSATDVQSGIDRMPWLANRLQEDSAG